MCGERVDAVVWSAKCVLSARETGGQILELFWLLGRFRASVLSKYLLDGDDGESIERCASQTEVVKKILAAAAVERKHVVWLL